MPRIAGQGEEVCPDVVSVLGKNWALTYPDRISSATLAVSSRTDVAGGASGFSPPLYVFGK